MPRSSGASNPAGVKDGLDPQTVQGLSTTSYRFPNLRVETVLTNTHVPLGPWRAPGHCQNAFFMESFIDELAHATGCRREYGWNLLGAISGTMKLSDQAATSTS